MKFLILLLTVAALQATAKGHAQKITLSLTNAPLQQAFTEINKQTGYNFIYTSEQLAATHPVSLKVKDESLQQVLQLCFLDQPLTFSIEDHYIIIKEKIQNTTPSLLDIKGKVTGENGEPLVGATVAVKGTSRAVATDDKGEFILTGLNPADVLIVSNVGYQTKEIPLNGKTFVEIQLNISVGSLDETIMIAYGKTTKRLSTGSISKLTAKEISSQPVSNPLAALEGRVPGLLITQTSGINGAGFKVQLRGQNSLLQGSDPFYIIDGVPFAPGNIPLNLVTNSTSSGGLSPFDLINPDDIESIEVLKDADATAIYGSRGANGVILITTKKGIGGKTNFDCKVYSGFSKVTRTMDMLNTQQYLAMRREAFNNDGIVPAPTKAPDLLLWDTTRYTDFKKLFTGGTANTLDAQCSISGGNSNTQFYLGSGYHRETTVLPTNLPDIRTSVHLSLNHTTSNKKFIIALSALYSYNINRLTTRDMTGLINTSPNLKLYDSMGNLNWQENGVPYLNLGLSDPNPMAFLKRIYKGQFQNLNSSLELSYQIFSGLLLKGSAGFNAVTGDEISQMPSKSIDIYSGTLPSANFANSDQKSWIIEPQLQYTKKLRKNNIEVLLGNTWQQNTTTNLNTVAYNYSSDLLLGSISGAGNVSTSNIYSLYRYNALFGRITYNYESKYILNISGRRDGSSRFGKEKQFADFSAIGGAWIFSAEKFAKKWGVLSFGKLRTSYGTAGNDQIGNYKFLDTWTSSAASYQGITSLVPVALYNPDYQWEINRKLELGLDLGFYKNRLLISLDYFRNRSTNQLVNYSLPIQTGFTFITENLDALVQNKGLEIVVSGRNIESEKFTWNTSFSWASYKNKLLDFPGLQQSSYSSLYLIGKSISARAMYHYQGVDPATGLYKYEDVNRDGTINDNDRIAVIDPDPKWSGSLSNTFVLGNFSTIISLEFRVQNGYNYLAQANLGIPAYGFTNKPVAVLDRWQKPGDQATIQKYSATIGPTLINANSYLRQSDGIFSDASYLRCKNISIAYTFPSSLIKKMSVRNARLFFEGQNLFTITRYSGADPEIQNMFILPPLRTFVGGIQLNF